MVVITSRIEGPWFNSGLLSLSSPDESHLQFFRKVPEEGGSMIKFIGGP